MGGVWRVDDEQRKFIAPISPLIREIPNAARERPWLGVDRVQGTGFLFNGILPRDRGDPLSGYTTFGLDRCCVLQSRAIRVHHISAFTWVTPAMFLRIPPSLPRYIRSAAARWRGVCVCCGMIAV